LGPLKKIYCQINSKSKKGYFIKSKDPDLDPYFGITDPNPGPEDQLITDPLDPDPQNKYQIYVN
jgi:hypothetical protein